MRRFIPGSSWIYLKVFSGPVLLEDLLLKVIYPKVIIFYEKQIIDEFFFVRFDSEEGYHIRLRFHLVDEKNFGYLVNELYTQLQPFVQNRAVHKILMDTYVRELERYKEVPIKYVETVFGYNSIQILQLLNSDENYESFLLKGIKIGDKILSSLGASNLDKYKIYETYYRGYSKELGFNNQVPIQLKNRYRELSRKLFHVFNELSSDIIRYENETISLIQTSKEEIIQSYKHRSGENFGEDAYYQLLKDILHMHYNRLFRVNQRIHEFVIYYMLTNFYKSKSIQESLSINRISVKTI